MEGVFPYTAVFCKIDVGKGRLGLIITMMAGIHLVGIVMRWDMLLMRRGESERGARKGRLRKFGKFEPEKVAKCWR
jgi:hypothetical protein